MRARVLILFTSTILCFVVNAEDSIGVSDENNPFPESIKINHNDDILELHKTGTALRKKFFLKIYSMNHYLEKDNFDSILSEATDDTGNHGDLSEPDDPEKIYQLILNSESAKQISIKFLRSLKAKQIKDSLLDGIKRNSSTKEFEQITPQVNEFMNSITADIEANDEFIIKWLNKDTLILIYQGKEINQIHSQLFARIFWSIWFGQYPVVKKQDLIEELLTSS